LSTLQVPNGGKARIFQVFKKEKKALHSA